MKVPSRVLVAVAVAVVTCLAIWVFIGLGGLPTTSAHEPDETYYPNGLYLATILSLIVAVGSTFLVDHFVGKSQRAPIWFCVGFATGIVIFLVRFPWANMDRFGGQAFTLLDWMIAPILGVAGYLGGALLDGQRSIPLRPSPPSPTNGSSMTSEVLDRYHTEEAKRSKEEQNRQIRRKRLTEVLDRRISEFVTSAGELGISPLRYKAAKSRGPRRPHWLVVLQLPGREYDGQRSTWGVSLRIFSDGTWEYAEGEPPYDVYWHPSDDDVRSAFASWLRAQL